MILTPNQSLMIIVTIAVATFLTRVIPFALFPNSEKTPKYIVYLGNVLPFSIIGMLIIYCLKEVSIGQVPYGLPELISIGMVVLFHKWRKNTLLSIGTGTILYMAIVQTMEML